MTSAVVVMRTAPDPTLEPLVGWRFALISRHRRTMILKALEVHTRTTLKLTVYNKDFGEFFDEEPVA